MEQIALKASLREGTGKEKATKLRRSGVVPGVVYHRGEDTISIALSEKELTRILRASEGENVLINLQVEGAKKKNRAVLIKEIQHHPVKRNILHIDFNEISMTEKIMVEVEIVGVGEPVGVKQDGGVLDHPLRMVKVQCLPADIPKHIDVDVSALKIGGVVHVSDLKLSDKVKVLTDGEAVLFTVKAHVEEKAEEAAAETQEVEVIREKKEEAPAAGAKAAEKKDEPKAEKK